MSIEKSLDNYPIKLCLKDFMKPGGLQKTLMVMMITAANFVSGNQRPAKESRGGGEAVAQNLIAFAAKSQSPVTHKQSERDTESLNVAAESFPHAIKRPAAQLDTSKADQSVRFLPACLSSILSACI